MTRRLVVATAGALLAVFATADAAIRLEAPADTIRVDEPFRVRASGLEPGARASVRLDMRWGGDGGHAHAYSRHFEARADESGRLELDAGDIIWAATRDSNLALPPPPHGLERLAFTVVGGGDSASVLVHRRLLAPGVSVHEVGDSNLVARLYLPAAGRPAPGVLALGGSECGIESASRWGALLSARGYAVLALAYCVWPDRNTGVKPPAMEQLAAGVDRVPIEYVEKALRRLAREPGVDASRLAVIGGSKGAELALLLAAAQPALRAVVAVAPSHVAWQSISPTWGATSSWSRGGEGLPYVSYSRDLARQKELAGSRELKLVHMYLASLDDTSAVRRAAIPVERIEAAVLLISGRDDLLWPSSVMAGAVAARMQAAGRRVRHLAFDDTGHAIGPPYYPTTAATSLGGTPAGIARARVEAWREALAFLQDRLEHSP